MTLAFFDKMQAKQFGSYLAKLSSNRVDKYFE